MNKLAPHLKIIIAIAWAVLSTLLGIALAEDSQVQLGLAILFTFAGLWMTELFPLSVTALMVPVAAYLTGILTPKASLAPFSSSIIFLFMGGFTLAAMLANQNVDRWLASKVLQLNGGRLWPTILSFLLVVIFLSMWMSNTSTTAMMLPIALSLFDKKYIRTKTFLLLGTAYAANIGGIATLVGSPPNAIAAKALDLDFMGWMAIGLPVTLVMFPIILAVLWWVIRPDHEQAEIQQDNLHYPMVWTSEAKLSIGVFVLTASLWIFSRPISNALGLSSMDAMVGVAVTALVPALGLIKWSKLQQKIDWGILLLFGGGLCLSQVLKETGTSIWLANEMLSTLQSAPVWLLMMAAIALMIFLTEFASNTGSAAILIPVIYSMANQFDPALTVAMVMAVGIAATCAFMLPVATPPNALVFSTGLIKQKQMLTAGLLLNLLAIPVIWLIVSHLS